MTKYLLAIGVFLSLSFLPSSAGDCKEAKKELAELQTKMNDLKVEGVSSADDVRAIKAELWKLKSENRELKVKNENLTLENQTLKGSK